MPCWSLEIEADGIFNEIVPMRFLLIQQSQMTPGFTEILREMK